uniref:Vpu protein n=1 Tax=Simian immunodeficiency virus TaxID=11723 RepID=J7IIW3_SIV|nr:vpu protein [Simian immunodeficiency virus]
MTPTEVGVAALAAVLWIIAIVVIIKAKRYIEKQRRIEEQFQRLLRRLSIDSGLEEDIENEELTLDDILAGRV